MKIVINVCFGGFSLSPAGISRLAELQGKQAFCYKQVTGKHERDVKRVLISPEEELDTLFFSTYDEKMPEKFVHLDSWYPGEEYSEWINKHIINSNESERNDPLLIQVVEELGEKSSGSLAELQIVEIPDDIKWHIEEYDGNEHVAEDHRTWR